MLTAVLRETPPTRVVELTERRYARPTVSRTFEGRDRFAPAAAWLAKGIAADGARAHRDATFTASTSRSRRSTATALRGVVLRVDRFGNLVTNIDRKTFEAFAKHGRVPDSGRRRARSAGSSSTYAEIRRRAKSCALFGSTDHLELAANAGSAAERLGLARHAVAEIGGSGQASSRRRISYRSGTTSCPDHRA